MRLYCYTCGNIEEIADPCINHLQRPCQHCQCYTLADVDLRTKHLANISTQQNADALVKDQLQKIVKAIELTEFLFFLAWLVLIVMITWHNAPYWLVFIISGLGGFGISFAFTRLKRIVHGGK